MRKRKRDLLNKHVGACFTAEDKVVLRLIKQEEQTTFAQLIRDAVYEKYSNYFKRSR